MALTDDPNDPRLAAQCGQNKGQHDTYLVLSEEERKKGFVRPVRRTYRHTKCGTHTTMGLELAQTYARDPNFYTHTYCAHCDEHPPVGEFTWANTSEVVGS